jgi:hypothetical protein
LRFSELANDNPNIQQQYDEWRQQRQNNGEDGADWKAFRQHVMAIGAPDPGEDAPEDLEGASQTATSGSVNA